MADQIQMDDNNKAMCWALRHPPGGEKPMPLWKIQLLVRKRNGKKATTQAISLAASTYKDVPCFFCYVYILTVGPWSTGNANFLSRLRPLHLFQPCPFPQLTPSRASRFLWKAGIQNPDKSKFHETQIMKVLNFTNVKYNQIQKTTNHITPKSPNYTNTQKHNNPKSKIYKNTEI